MDNNVSHLKKNVAIEIVWLVGIAALIAVLIPLAPGFSSTAGAFEIQLHDTYFVVDFWTCFGITFFNVAFGIALVKQGINRFTILEGNFVLLAMSAVLICTASCLLTAIVTWSPSSNTEVLFTEGATGKLDRYSTLAIIVLDAYLLFVALVALRVGKYWTRQTGMTKS